MHLDTGWPGTASRILFRLYARSQKQYRISAKTAVRSEFPTSINHGNGGTADSIAFYCLMMLGSFEMFRRSLSLVPALLLSLGCLLPVGCSEGVNSSGVTKPDSASVPAAGGSATKESSGGSGSRP